MVKMFNFKEIDYLFNTHKNRKQNIKKTLGNSALFIVDCLICVVLALNMTKVYSLSNTDGVVRAKGLLSLARGII